MLYRCESMTEHMNVSWQSAVQLMFLLDAPYVSELLTRHVL